MKTLFLIAALIAFVFIEKCSADVILALFNSTHKFAFLGGCFFTVIFVFMNVEACRWLGKEALKANDEP